MSDLIKLQNQLHYTLGTRGFFFLACGWMFRCRPQADMPTDLRSKAGRSYESQFKELSDTGNSA